jgi:hypothetical protein
MYRSTNPGVNPLCTFCIGFLKTYIPPRPSIKKKKRNKNTTAGPADEIIYYTVVPL